MDSKVDLSFSRSSKCNEIKAQICQYHQQMRGKLLIAVFIFGILSVVQFCWNLHLNSELNKVQENINFLLTNCHQQQPNNRDYYDSDVTKLDSNDVSTKIEDNEVPKPSTLSKSHKLPSGHQEKLLRIKRSKGSKKKRPPKKPAKSNKRKLSISSMIRKRKGLAVHVQARRPTQQSGSSSLNSYRGVTVPGNKITNWEILDAEHSNKSKFGLAELNTHGCLEIPVDGFYFVYAQVVFTRTPSIAMSAYLGFGYTGARPFTKCLLSKSVSASSTFYNTCHVNGVKYLEKSQCVAITVQPPGVEVYMDPMYTYFGAYFVGLAAD